MTVSAEQAAHGRAPVGISEADMGAGWRAIIARRDNGDARSWYFHVNDDKRIADALRHQAQRYYKAGL